MILHFLHFQIVRKLSFKENDNLFLCEYFPILHIMFQIFQSSEIGCTLFHMFRSVISRAITDQAGVDILPQLVG